MRYKHLDGIRGLASIFVVLSHISQLYIPYLINGNINYMHSKMEQIFIEFPFSLFYSGNSMVYIFMIIGGFVTATSCLNEEKILLIKKIVMRYIRLVIPIFITTLLVCFILNTTGFGYNDIDNYTLNSGIIVTKEKMSIFTAIKYSFYDIFVYDDLFSGNVLSYNAVLWTIKVEFWCSIILYLIYRLIKNNSYFRITLIIIIMFMLPINSKLFYYSFFIGAIIAELYYIKNKKKCITYNNSNIFTYTLLGLLSLYLLGYPYVNNAISYKFLDNIVINEIIVKINNSNILGVIDKGSLLHFVGVIIFLVIIINSKTIQRLFSQKYIFKLGSLSYYIYLLHWILLLWIVPIFLELLNYKLNYYGNLYISIIVFLVILIIGSIILKKLSNYIILFIKNKVISKL